MNWELLEPVLRDTGFLLAGDFAPGLLDADRVTGSAASAMRYGAFVGSVADLVYEVPNDIPGLPGNPCIYFKSVDSISSETVTQLRSKIWNQGRTPFLWLVDTKSVRIYSCVGRPKEEDDDKAHLLFDLDATAQQLKACDAIHRHAFDSGAAFRNAFSEAGERHQRVDEALLSDLAKAQGLLHSADHQRGLSHSSCNALLGRIIFAAYLWDRQILTPQFFRSRYSCGSLIDLLESKSGTYKFFSWLKDTFNGHLFPVTTDERKQVTELHLAIIRAFLSGDDLTNYPQSQKRFWPYRFDVIPIELISSIYEKFAHGRAPDIANSHGVHYTRLSLVELILNLAMRGLSAKSTILDPACGSGVFLVEGFRRLAWLNEKETGRRLNRTELRQLLTDQVFGIDIDAEAIAVTAFSLYLALLELDDDPQPPSALRFPYLVASKRKDEPAHNLYAANFFDAGAAYTTAKPFSGSNFDLIVGNPPWTSVARPKARAKRVQKQQVDKYTVEYCEKHQIPDRKPDQAFLLRARDYLKETGKAAFVVGSRIFTQQPGVPIPDRWLTGFSSDNTLEAVVNLTDLVDEGILFGDESSTRFPASVIIFRRQKPKPDHNVFYLTPRWYRSARERSDIVLTSDDMHDLSQELLRTWPVLWKTALRGTPRDFQLVQKLAVLESLDGLLDSLGIHTGSDRARGVTKSSNPSFYVAALNRKPYLDSNDLRRFSVDVRALSLFNGFVSPKSNKRLFRLPSLVLSRSLQEGKPAAAVIEPSGDRQNVVVNQMYYAMSLASLPHDLTKRLNAVLNSNLALYSAFMASPALGIDRRLIEVNDWLNVPVPASIRCGDAPEWAEITRLEDRLRQEPNADIEGELNALLCDVYGLSTQERILVEDTIKFGIRPVLRRDDRTLLTTPPANSQLNDYAKCLGTQLAPLMQAEGMTLTHTFIVTRVDTIAYRCEAESRLPFYQPEPKIVTNPDFERVLESISQSLRAEVSARFSINRDLRVYDGNAIWIIKPAERRLWSRSAALADADSVVGEHLADGPRH